MPIQHITTLLEFCLQGTYLLFQGKYYEQVHGAALGSPISPIMANLFMEHFDPKAINTVPICPGFGLDMWMTPFLSNRQNTANSSYDTLIPFTHTYSSPQSSQQ